MTAFKHFFALIRASHWSKAIFVLLGVIYSDQSGYWLQALLATIAFCLVASAVYIYNDLHDVDEDRLHPKKSRRPIANEDVSSAQALAVLISLLVLGLFVGFYVSKQLAFILLVYLLINVVYNHWLRAIPICDVLCIASGFMLRIFAGTVGIGLPITWWLTLTATLFSLFIAFCKRRLQMQPDLISARRAVLEKYNPQTLDNLIVITAVSCFFSYLIYTIYVREYIFYFVLTWPFAALGLWRFVSLTSGPSVTDDPVAFFCKDKLSALNLGCFLLLTLMALV